jgi:hypothetical protein
MLLPHQLRTFHASPYPYPEEECFKVALTEEQLEDVSGFGKDSWPKTYDETFVKSVYSHHGVKR